MKVESLHAFKVTSAAAAGPAVHVVVARDLAEAASLVRDRLDARFQVQRLDLIAPALVLHDSDGARRRRKPVTAPAQATPPPQSRPVPEPTTRRLRRRDQLVAALQDHGRPMHVSEIAAALDTNQNNASNAITDALKHGLVRRIGSRTGLVELVHQGAATAVEPAPPEPTLDRPLLRRDRLVQLLIEQGETLHIDAIAMCFDTNLGNAHSIVRDAVRHGLVRRVGSRSGLVELAQQGIEQQPVEATKPPAGKRQPAKPAPRKKKRGGPSHADRLVQLLRDRGEPVHLDAIVQVLGTTRGTVQEVIRHAAKAGRVRRVGSRTGLVALPAAAPSEPVQEEPQRPEAPVLPPAASEEAPTGRQAAPVPASSAGLAARVLAALEAADGWCTAREVAAALGCRPREIGNGLALLVERGVVDRRCDGDGPAAYRCR